MIFLKKIKKWFKKKMIFLKSSNLIFFKFSKFKKINKKGNENLVLKKKWFSYFKFRNFNKICEELVLSEIHSYQSIQN